MPSAKKERSRRKKRAAAPGRSLPPALRAAAARLEAANAASDLSTGMEAFLSIDLPVVQVATEPGDHPLSDTAVEPIRMEIRAPTNISKVDARKMYELLTANVRDLYVEAGWGWDEVAKRREMEHPQARFLVARLGSTEVVEGRGATPSGKAALDDAMRASLNAGSDDDVNGGGDAGRDPGAALAMAAEEATIDEGGRGQLAGFCHFRFSWDQDDEENGEGVGASGDVLYVYEIQVAPWAKRRGLGRRMMQALELLANRHGMSKVMLTVFKINKQAMSFYTKRMKYSIDEDSPSNWDRPDEVYEILSKPTRHWAARASLGREATMMLD
ncbi:unnamed protein product [Ascophyllum nodosum]